MNCGLSEKEARLYLFCLKTGTTTANRLISLSGFPRATVYDILERLINRGLVSSLSKENTTFFSANDPATLLKELEEKKESVERILPKLAALNNTVPKRIQVELFEGMTGVRKILDDILANCKEVRIMGNEKHAREIAKHHSENFRMKRLARKIRIKNLLEGSPVALSLKDDRYSEVRHHPKLLDSSEVLIIYNDVTVHMIMEEPITTIKITSAGHTRSESLLFDELWKNAKKGLVLKNKNQEDAGQL